ncbi:hypothetical protein Y032_0297g1737 [Ancylostoma ceylanicum]|uniref:Uncharacterized protein n=1 Tax=Ancylostoma ceylanicum TaxID=53326 RepID=A0A016S5I9_9BILA|nr:hypothetical protein Y032_0297g1737 [Ancylostoma ceylanicum]
MLADGSADRRLQSLKRAIRQANYPIKSLQNHTSKILCLFFVTDVVHRLMLTLLCDSSDVTMRTTAYCPLKRMTWTPSLDQKSSHRMLQHDGENFKVSVKILAQEPNTSARKTLEASWIQAKNSENKPQGRMPFNHEGARPLF